MYCMYLKLIDNAKAWSYNTMELAGLRDKCVSV